MSEYGPQPAVNAGWLKTALPEAVKPMTELMAGFRAQAEALARSTAA